MESGPYTHILVPLDTTPADETILDHVRVLARACGARLTIIHVADGFMARNQQRLAESPEMEDDRAYLDRRREELVRDELRVESVLVCGEPADQILAYAAQCGCDLIAMATHGHRGLADVILGSVASAVRHRTDVPVLLVRSKQ